MEDCICFGGRYRVITAVCRATTDSERGANRTEVGPLHPLTLLVIDSYISIAAGCGRNPCPDWTCQQTAVALCCGVNFTDKLHERLTP